MEAKDTVMSDEELQKLFDLAYYQNQAYNAGMIQKPFEPEDLMKKVAEAQATISFKVGIREVVELIKQKGWFGTDWERHIPERMGYKGKSGHLVFFTEDDLKGLEEK